jgi:hypothetical protein
MRVPSEVRNPAPRIERTGANRVSAPTVEGTPQETPAQQQERAEAARLAQLPAMQSIRGQDGFDTASTQAAQGVGAARPTGALPPPAALNLEAPVGAVPGNRPGNRPADVRAVQERLHGLGYLSASDYQAERVDAGGQGRVAESSMPRTMEALRRFQGQVAGGTDGVVSPGGAAARALADPTYGTQTTINPRASDTTAGVPLESMRLPRDVEQIVRAVEAVETGSGALGESPALLRNASGTPASFGRGQLIGGTAVSLLNSSPELARRYELGPQEMRRLTDIATRTTAHYNAIAGRVPRGGDTEAGLQRRIAEYTATEGARFRQETGLGDADIANMFRAAQLRNQMAANRGGNIDRLLASPDVAANVRALGLSTSDLAAYRRNPAFHGEHRAGFVTRALFSTSPEGQRLRNAMTDNGGVPISRLLIQQNHESVLRAGQQQLGRPLTPREAAQATMFVHNHGERGLPQYLAGLNRPNRREDAYVQRAMQGWTP